MAKLSKTQEALLKRIMRCPNGCFIERFEIKTVGVLIRRGLVRFNESLTVAYPVAQ